MVTNLHLIWKISPYQVTCHKLPNQVKDIQGGTTILGNAYGGGNEGPVGGNSEVKIQDD